MEKIKLTILMEMYHNVVMLLLLLLAIAIWQSIKSTKTQMTIVFLSGSMEELPTIKLWKLAIDDDDQLSNYKLGVCLGGYNKKSEM